MQQSGGLLPPTARRRRSLIERVPSGVPIFSKLNMVDVAQLVSASDCGSEGRGFDSHHPPHKVPISSWNRNFSFICTFKSTGYKASNSRQLTVLCAPKNEIRLHKSGCHINCAKYQKLRLTQIWPKRENFQKSTGWWNSKQGCCFATFTFMDRFVHISSL